MRWNRTTNKTAIRALKIVVGGVVLIGLGTGRVLLNLKPKKLKPIEDLELLQFSGSWYEIARKPVTIERRSFKNIITKYTIVDETKLKVEWLYNTDEGKLGQLFGEATIANAPHNSKFKMSYLPEFLHALRAKPYMIIRIDPDYQIVLIGNRQRSHLWLLARSPHLPENIRENYLSFAQEQGFKLDDLIYVEHT